MCVNVFPKIYPTLIWSGLAGESQRKKSWDTVTILALLH